MGSSDFFSMDAGKIILLAGPTCSGKSELAVRLAEKFHGAIINADALQLYRDLPILTAQPSIETRARTHHRLYEIADPTEIYSAGRWLQQAKEAIAAAQTESLTPIVTGGTGLYFRCLMHGIAPIPAIPESLRQTLRADYAQQGEAALRQRLAKNDPEALSRIVVGDKLRLLRALEIVLATGKTQTEWQKFTSGGLGSERMQPILIMPPRDALYQACDARFTAMIEKGAMQEAKALLAKDLPPDAPIKKVIGLRDIGEFLRGEVDWPKALSQAQQATRNYAKRQMTWFRNQWQNRPDEFAHAPLIHYGFSESFVL
jgi:tRNA dimethylallyltransferase